MPPPLVAPTLAVALSWALPGAQDVAAAPPHPSAGVPVVVQVVVLARDPVPESEVVAEPTATASPGAFPNASATTERGKATLLLEPGVWRLTARCEGWWAWARDITVGPGEARPGPVTLELSPVGKVGGTVAPASGESPPEGLRLRVRRDTDAESWASDLAGDVVACDVDHRGRWACEVPAEVSVDLDLEMPPFSPMYFWDVEAPRGGTRDLGRAPAMRGASVSGWVAGAEERELGQRAFVELRSPGGSALEDDHEETPTQTTPFRTPASPRGFFQLRDLTAGHYELTAAAGPFRSPPTRVEVREGVETRLRHPLVLEPPAALRLSLNPASHPDGEPWRIRIVDARGPRARMVVHDDEVSAEGTWHKLDLPAGEYQLMVTGGEEGIWFSDTVVLEPGEDDDEVQIEMTRVAGTVTLGDSPLAGAQVRIAERSSGRRASFRTDDEGQFSGIYPAVDLGEARWRADVKIEDPRTSWKVDHVEPESASEELLTFAISISDTAIEGRVVDEKGTPQRAFVTALIQTVSEGEAARILETSTDESTGEFRLAGLSDGDYGVSARAPVPGGERRELSSPVATVHVGDSESPAPLVLVVTEETEIVGRVTTSGGMAVPGALVLALSTDTPSAMTLPVRTDAEGRFVARVPPGTRNVVIDVRAVGTGRRFFGRVASECGRLSIELDPVGRLVFDLGESQDPGPPRAGVYHDGAWVPLAELARWSGRHGEPTEPGVLRVPFMHAGSYRVCLAPSQEEYLQLLAGVLPDRRCDEGMLWPGGELRLRLPTLAEFD